MHSAPQLPSQIHSVHENSMMVNVMPSLFFSPHISSTKDCSNVTCKQNADRLQTNVCTFMCSVEFSWYKFVNVTAHQWKKWKPSPKIHGGLPLRTTRTRTNYSSKTLDRIIPLKHPCMSVTGDFSYNGDNIKVNVVNGQETLLPISLLII